MLKTLARFGAVALVLWGASSAWQYEKRSRARDQCSETLADRLHTPGKVATVGCTFGTSPNGFDTCELHEADAEGNRSSKRFAVDCEALASGVDPQIHTVPGP